MNLSINALMLIPFLLIRYLHHPLYFQCTLIIPCVHYQQHTIIGVNIIWFNHYHALLEQLLSGVGESTKKLSPTKEKGEKEVYLISGHAPRCQHSYVIIYLHQPLYVP